MGVESQKQFIPSTPICVGCVKFGFAPLQHQEPHVCLCKCPSVEKCLDTAEFFFTNAKCLHILFLNALPVSPTYFILNLLHVIRSTLLFNLHVKFLGIL